jgi:two-component system, LytTR family, sensor kinase
MSGDAPNKTSHELHAVAGKLPPLSMVRVWSVVFLIYTAIFITDFEYRYLDDLSRQRTGTFGIRFLEEATGVYIVFLLLPLIFLYARRYLFNRVSPIKQIAMHILGSVAFSALHTALMALSRQILSPLLGMGKYNYGIMSYRYPMEFSNDFVGYTVTVLAYYAFERYRISQAEKLAASELQTKLAQAQLENLRLQVQPHFLFNTLNTISSVMYEDIKTADAMITQLSDLLRLTLQASRSHEIPLGEELEIARLYLDLMQKRYESKLRVTYSIDPSLNGLLVPQLILQPLLENSLRHGMKSGSAMDLSIAAHREDGSLILQVSDNGSGLGMTEPGKVLGLGLSNIRDRLAQLYGERQQFSISNRNGGGAEVTLRVPLHTSDHVTQAAE